MGLAGQNQTNLTNSAAMETDPAYSPDGKNIAFKTDRSGNEDIYTMTF
jgi:TolB protein